MSSGTKEPKPGVDLDFSDVLGDENNRQMVDAATSRAALEVAKQAGFSARAELVPHRLARRNIKKSAPKVQFNFRIKPEIRDEFILASSAFPTLEEFLGHLLKINKLHGLGK